MLVPIRVRDGHRTYAVLAGHAPAPPHSIEVPLHDPLRIEFFLRPLLVLPETAAALRTLADPNQPLLPRLVRLLLDREVRFVLLPFDSIAGGTPGADEVRRVSAPAKTTLQKKTLRIRFQICGGEVDGLGIAGAEYVFTRSDGERAEGKTDENGEVKIEYVSGQTHAIRIFGTDYRVRLHRGYEEIGTLEGIQKRLDTLGYMTGYLLEPIGNDVPDDGLDGPRTQQAIMNFQADHGLAIDGVPGARTKEALQDAAGA